MTFSGNIASQYLQARIAAFDRAHRLFRLCKPCLDREVAERRVIALPRHDDSIEPLDPTRDWCFLCGAVTPTLPALPRGPRSARRAA
jgi:hypothetical protein